MGTGYTTFNPYFSGSSELKNWFPYFPGKHSIWNIQFLNKSRNHLLLIKKKWTFNDVDVVALARKIDTVMKSLPLIEWNSTPNFETRPGQEIAPNETVIDFHLGLIFCRPLSPPLKLLLEENRQVWRKKNRPNCLRPVQWKYLNFVSTLMTFYHKEIHYWISW